MTRFPHRPILSLLWLTRFLRHVIYETQLLRSMEYPVKYVGPLAGRSFWCAFAKLFSEIVQRGFMSFRRARIPAERRAAKRRFAARCIKSRVYRSPSIIIPRRRFRITACAYHSSPVSKYEYDHLQVAVSYQSTRVS